MKKELIKCMLINNFEIGSEFSYDEHNHGEKIILPKLIEDYTYTFSGRTAIETVLKNEIGIKKALLPSYCCDSMIVPFRKHGIKVDFYSVNYVSGVQVDLCLEEDIDAIMWCNYFGYTMKMPDLSEFINRGGIIIEDITHSFYSDNKYNKQSDYLIAYIRKWEAILCGGYCAAVKKKMSYKPFTCPSENYLKLKRTAMILKSEYLSGKINIEKETFMHLFSEANEWLAENFSCKAIDEYSENYLFSVDYDMHRKQRRSNARILYEGLQNHLDIDFLFPIEDMDCPLFVPVIIRNGKRDAIRKKLIKNAIYCPVHWPHPNADCNSNLYEYELSLVCDHRYDEKDMQRIVDVLWKIEREE